MCVCVCEIDGAKFGLGWVEIGSIHTPWTDSRETGWAGSVHATLGLVYVHWDPLQVDLYGETFKPLNRRLLRASAVQLDDILTIIEEDPIFFVFSVVRLWY